MKTIRIHDAIYEIEGENHEMMEELNITNREAHNINYLQSKARKTRERLRDEKQREERPWLYDGTPQNHDRGKWCEYLMNTSIFPKAVR